MTDSSNHEIQVMADFNLCCAVIIIEQASCLRAISTLYFGKTLGYLRANAVVSFPQLNSFATLSSKRYFDVRKDFTG